MLKRPFHRGQKDKENEYKTLHTECTVYTTGHRFPGILRWFEVVDTEVVGWWALDRVTLKVGAWSSVFPDCGLANQAIWEWDCVKE